MPSETPRRCGRRTRSGGACTQWVMHGQTVCKMHGGKSPQALAKAEQRMRELIHPAIASLERQIKANEFPAARYVLDWAGFKATEKIESDAEVVVRVVHEDQPLLTLDVPYAPRNGHVET